MNRIERTTRTTGFQAHEVHTNVVELARLKTGYSESCDTGHPSHCAYLLWKCLARLMKEQQPFIPAIGIRGTIALSDWQFMYGQGRCKSHFRNELDGLTKSLLLIYLSEWSLSWPIFSMPGWTRRGIRIE